MRSQGSYNNILQNLHQLTRFLEIVPDTLQQILLILIIQLGG